MEESTDSGRKSVNPHESTESNENEIPKLTLKSFIMDIYNGINALLFDPFCNRIICPLVIVITSILTKLVISMVKYTEIDFTTYMQQIQLINMGEIDYAEIYGDSGPIVYPAGFVQIYQWIASITDDGTDIRTAQKLFGYLLTFTNLFVVLVYTMSPGFQPWPFYLLLTSKRLISIYVLRLFNDCFTTACMVAVTLILQQASYWYSTNSSLSFFLSLVAADLYSIAISIKMNALLYLPAFIIVVYFLSGESMIKSLVVLVVIPFVQIIMGWKFLLPLFDDEGASQIRWNYIKQAFNFERQFLYEWTVNWRFFSEEVFTSQIFSKSLLVLHVLTLTIFILSRYLRPSITGKSYKRLVKDILNPFATISSKNLFVDSTYGPRLILLTLATTNLIGILFSRSLHYQFLSWYCWQLPFLLHSTGWNIYICIILWGLHEYAWNVFPSTPRSSLLLVIILSATTVGIWKNLKVWSHGETTPVDEAKKND